MNIINHFPLLFLEKRKNIENKERINLDRYYV